MAAAFSLEPPNQDTASASKSDKLLGLTPGKAEKMKRAIANQRALEKIIDELRAITQKLMNV
jgi:hypothetical protein